MNRPLPFLETACAALVVASCGRSESNQCVTPDATADTVVATATDTSADSASDGADDSSAGDTSHSDAKSDVADSETSLDTSLPQCPWSPWDEGLFGGRVDFVGFDPRVPGVVWATAGPALLRSDDGGASWEQASDDVGPRAVVFPPNDGKALLAGTTSGIWVSHDIGASFEPDALAGLGIESLFVHPASPLRVYVGTAGAGILRSDDGGAGFAARNVGVPRMLVEAFAAPADDLDVVLATGVLENDTYGVGTSGVILRSGDGGRSWATVSTDVVWGYDISVCPEDPRHVLAAVRKGVLESKDGGLTWSRLPILGTKDVLTVAWQAGTCDTFWASVYQSGVFRVEDGGLTLFGPLVDGFDFEVSRFAGRLAAHPSEPEVLLVSTHAGLYRSVDGGFHWDAVSAGKGLLFADMDATPGPGSHVWMSTWGNGLWTRAPGSTWKKVGALPRDFVATVAPISVDDVVVGSNSDGFVTRVGGAAFDLMNGPKNVQDAVALDSGELLAASQVSGVWRSVQPAVAWTESNQGLTPFETPNGTFIDARDLRVDPNVVGRVYVALRGAGVAVSDDLGHSWMHPANDLQSDAVIHLALDGRNGTTRIYAQVDGKGVFVSTDGAQTWTSKNGGLDSLGGGDLAIDPVSGKLFLSGDSIYASDDGLDWRAFDRYCLPVEGWGPLAVMEDGDGRWLVAAAAGNRVVRHKL
ncbi:MAG: hypothetical protein U1F43_21160 [Myxococcota bacterium]